MSKSVRYGSPKNPEKWLIYYKLYYTNHGSQSSGSQVLQVLQSIFHGHNNCITSLLIPSRLKLLVDMKWFVKKIIIWLVSSSSWLKNCVPTHKMDITTMCLKSKKHVVKRLLAVISLCFISFACDRVTWRYPAPDPMHAGIGSNPHATLDRIKGLQNWWMDELSVLFCLPVKKSSYVML